MARVWYKRGVAHRIGRAPIGAPAWRLGSPTSFINRKLADNAPLVNDGNDYATKLAHQARYTTTSTPVAGYFNPPFEISLNTATFGAPLWVMPAGYARRKVTLAKTGAGDNFKGTGVFTQGSNQVTGVTATWANNTPLVTTVTSYGGSDINGFVPEGTTVLSQSGTTVTLSNPASKTGTGRMFTILPDSYVFGLQGVFDSVPIPHLSDMPSWWSASWGTRLCANGSDQACYIYQPSTDTMWEIFQFSGDESSGYTGVWGGRIDNLSQNSGTIPNNWGTKACSILGAAGSIYAQDFNDGIIPHALCVGLPVTAPSHLAPATRNDSSALVPSGSFADAVPEGAIFRLPPDVFIDPTWDPFLTMVVKAARDYGMWIADTSGSVQFNAEDPRSVGTMFSPAQQGQYFVGNGPAFNVFMSNQFPWESLVQVAYP